MGRELREMIFLDYHSHNTSSWRIQRVVIQSTCFSKLWVKEEELDVPRGDGLKENSASA